MNKPEYMKKLSNIHANEIEQAIKQVMPTLIQAFINVYGGQHESHIRDTINNLKFAYFIPRDQLEYMKEEGQDLDRDDKNIINSYLDFLDVLDLEFEHLKGDDDTKLKFIYRNYLAKSDLDEDFLIKYNIVDMMDDDCPVFSLRAVENPDGVDIVKIILLPVLLIDLKMIIHEINHALYIDAVALQEKRPLIPTPFKFRNKDGYDNTAEEIINDKIGIAVYKEFLRIGGVIPPVLQRFRIPNAYEENDYIVDYLYQKLGAIIKECLISRNFNLFLRGVGKENHDYLCYLMSFLYNYGFDEAKLTELWELIDKLSIIFKDIQEANYDDYCQELESLGYKVRRV